MGDRPEYYEDEETTCNGCGDVIDIDETPAMGGQLLCWDCIGEDDG